MTERSLTIRNHVITDDNPQPCHHGRRSRSGYFCGELYLGDSRRMRVSAFPRTESPAAERQVRRLAVEHLAAPFADQPQSCWARVFLADTLNAIVLRLRLNELKILVSVVILHAVDVMDHLFREKIAANTLLNYQTVLANISSFCGIRMVTHLDEDIAVRIHHSSAIPSPVLFERASPFAFMLLCVYLAAVLVPSYIANRALILDHRWRQILAISCGAASTSAQEFHTSIIPHSRDWRNACASW